MNNLRFIAGLLLVTLHGGAVWVAGQDREILTIEDLFETAETHSTQLRPSFTAEKIAEMESEVARTERLPDIKTSLSFSYIGDGFTTRRNFSDYQKAPIPHFGSGLTVEITQPIYTGGAISAGIALADLKSTAARYATELQRDDIRFRLAGFYLDIYKYENLRLVVENNISQAEKVLSEMKARFEQGMALQNDITRYELLLSNLDLRLTGINNTLDILTSSLITIAGLPEGMKFRTDPSILNRSLPEADEEWWQQESINHSPTLRLAHSDVEMAKASETIVRSKRLPSIGLRAGWSIDGPILVEIPPINRNLSYWYVGVGVSYDLSSLYKSKKAIAGSRLSTLKSIEQQKVTAENLSLAVHADYIRYLEAREELKTQTKSVELADKNYLTTSTRYSAGMALITDMLDAANSKLEAEQQLVNARINIIYYYYKLLFISGKI